MDERVILGFTGRLVPTSMTGFACHRARRLDVEIEVLDSSDDELRVAVRGQPDLIDAFEMALSLGPGDSLVLEVWRDSNSGPRAERKG